MNTDLMFSSASDDWATPNDFFQELDKEFHFNLDPCADDHNHKCEKYYTAESNGLLQDWGGIGCFVTHLMAEKLLSGYARHIMKATKTIHLYVC